MPIVVKPVYDLREHTFHVPPYQRGYRWDSTQVVDLLNDLKKYALQIARDTQTAPAYYCLQPLVVVNNNSANSEDNTNAPKSTLKNP